MKIGIIGGSGLDDPRLLSDYSEKEINTPYGRPSSKISCGNLKGVEVCILARHGKKHEINPSKINFRANIFALKELGCEIILATNAVGSLREEIKPGNLVFPDQFIDFTKFRKNTFFDKYRDEYYERLLAVSQKGEWEEWISFFLRAIVIQSKDSAENSRAILKLLENYRNRIQEKRTSIYVARLLEELFKNPYVSIPRAALKLNTSFHTAKAAIEKLKKADILVEITDKQRGKVYCAKELLSLLEGRKEN